MKFEFIQQYYQTILLIIEDRPKYDIPIFFYKVLIFISYLQIYIYLLTENEARQINDYKLQAITQIIQTISLKNILQLRNSYTSSLVIYIIIYIFMYSYFIYVGILAFIKHRMVNFYESKKKVFIQINQILNLYFALYIQIIFTQFVELNSSIMFCSENSLLEDQRVVDSSRSCNVPTWLSIIGFIGLFLTLITAWIAVYFFRNYEFMEYNLIKRKASNLFSLLILLKFILTVLYFANISGQDYIKHILSQLVGLLSLADYFFNNPYSDIRVANFYLTVISWYYTYVNLTHIWLFTNSISSNEFFYSGLIIGLLVNGFFQSINNYQYDCFLLTEVKYDYLPPKLDFYLEEIVRLAVESEKNEFSKVQLQKLIKNHVQTCLNADCPCKKTAQNQNNNSQQKGQLQNRKQDQMSESLYISGKTVLSEKIKIKKKEDYFDNEERNDGELEFEYILSIVDAIFKFYLSQSKVNKDQAEYEHLSLKYITFMIKFLKNYTRANYELKILQFQREDFSSYFKLIARIVSEKIKDVISNMNIHLELRRKDELSVRQIIGVDTITIKYMQLIIKVMSEKQKLWSSLQQGYRNMNQFQNQILKLMTQIHNLKIQFFQDMAILQRQLKKLYLVFFLFISNDSVRAYELEMLVQELRKRDSLKDIDSLSNDNLLKENMITLTVSLSQSIGKIFSKKDAKTANFFGYSKQDFMKITKINELMLPVYAKVHDQIIKSFVNSGESKYIKSSKYVYGRDQSGFVMPLKLYLDFSFITENDFQVNGTLLKVNQAFDYILFHRSGKVVGITNKIASLLLNNTLRASNSQTQNKLPSGEYISNNLSIHLLLPVIAKRIFKRKESILSGFSSDQDILLQDRKGQIIMKSNPLLEVKKLQIYAIKSAQVQNNKKKGITSSVLDQLDLFSEKSYQLINSYKKSDIEHASTVGLSSGRASSGRSAVSKQSLQGREKKKYKIRFNYTLSYNSISTHSNYEKDLYFQLKMSDLNLTRVKDKQRSYLKTNLLTYLLSTSLIGKLDQKYKNKNNSALNNFNSKEKNDSNRASQQLNCWSFCDQDIPAKLIKIVTQNESLMQAQEKEKQNDGNDHDAEDDEKNKKQNNSDSSSDDDDNNDYTDEEDEEDVVNIDSLRNKKKLLDQYEDNAKFTELNQVLQEHKFTEEDILKLDPNFKIKKVIQYKTLSSAFGRALEKAVVEALLEMDKEKNDLLQSHLDDFNMAEDATFRDFNAQNQSNLINQTDQMIILQNKQESRDTSFNSRLSKQPTGLEKLNSNIVQRQDLNASTYSVVQDNSILPSFNNPFSNQEHHFDVSSDNLQTYKIPDDKSKYFDASARPLFKQHGELAIDDYLVSPSVIDDRSKNLQQSNSGNVLFTNLNFF